MHVTTSGFLDTGDIMIIPVFEGFKKAPNNVTSNLGRGASIAVKSAFLSEAFDGKIGESLRVWTKNCQVILLGLGEKRDLTLKKSRDNGAKFLRHYQKIRGLKLLFDILLDGMLIKWLPLQKE